MAVVGRIGCWSGGSFLSVRWPVFGLFNGMPSARVPESCLAPDRKPPRTLSGFVGASAGKTPRSKNPASVGRARLLRGARRTLPLRPRNRSLRTAMPSEEDPALSAKEPPRARHCDAKLNYTRGGRARVLVRWPIFEEPLISWPMSAPQPLSPVPAPARGIAEVGEQEPKDP